MINRIDPARVYHEGQCCEHFIPRIKHLKPEWFINCGPGSANEHVEMRQQWPAIKLFGLEPSTIGFEVASKRWPADGWLFKVAAWDSDGEVRMMGPNALLHSNCYGDGTGQWEAVLADQPLPLDSDRPDSVIVPCRTLDSLSEDFGPFENAVLWMDIEGAERRALRGAKGLLERGGPIAVNVETRPWYEDVIGDLLKAGGLKKVHRYLVCDTFWDEIWIKV